MYKTVHEFGQDEVIIEKSTFIGYAKPVKTEEEAVELSVFPNPTTDKISVNSNEEILSISVYNLAGNKLLDLDVNKTEWSLGLDAGTYILTVETAKNTISRKIIVK